MPTPGEGSSCDLIGSVCFKCVPENMGFKGLSLSLPLGRFNYRLDITWNHLGEESQCGAGYVGYVFEDALS